MQQVRPASSADVLALGFGAAAAMWTVGYFVRLPTAMNVGFALPSSVLFFMLILIVLCAGYLAGRLTLRGAGGGALVGLIAGLVNLLVLGSLLSRQELRAIDWTRLFWIPVSIGITVLLACCGAVVGILARPGGVAVSAVEQPRDPYADPGCDAGRHVDTPWAGLFGTVTAGLTLVLLSIGGTVTGADAGLAVVDWPNSFGYNMFLYPLARMTGGIYLEHAHRLFGSLVGLTVLVQALYLWRRDPRTWMRALGWLSLVLVIVQGVLGGLRVTGKPTFSDSPLETAPNLYLAVAHGVLGQAFFALLVALAVFQTAGWVRGRAYYSATAQNNAYGPTATDGGLTQALVGVLLAQLVLGAIVRHFTWSAHLQPNLSSDEAARLVQMGQWALGLHIVGATVGAALALAVGMRAWGLFERVRPLHHFGLLLMIGVAAQLGLGIAAYVCTGDDSPQNLPTNIDVVITTLHQTIGAILLGGATALALWSARLSIAPAAAAMPANADWELRRANLEERI